MRNAICVGVVAAVSLTSSPYAHGAEPGARRLSWATRYPIIGRLDAPKTLTGGPMPNVQAAFAIPVGEGELRVGGELGMFGFGAPSGWLGILGGIYADIGGRPVATIPVGVVLTGRLSAGRVPVINAWGYPLSYSGLYPGAALALSWEANERVRLDAGIEGLLVLTYSWRDVAPGPVLRVTGSF